MTELVGRIPLLRTLRLRPRKPKPDEWLGLVIIVVYGVLLGAAIRDIATGTFITGQRFGTGEWPRSAAFDYAAHGLVVVLAGAFVVLGVALVWDWLKDPWERR